MDNGAEIPFVLGTAGHIDHGKTALVRALTGIDCDLLEEEKRRGITIELGFAPCLLPSGKTMSIVDVPGHERFIRQMVAGSAGIDAVMLVVAADEGVMPQTREHLDILTLLGVSSGLVVINKADLADPEILELVQSEIEELTQGTFLVGCPVLRVSATRGTGIDALRGALDALAASVKPRSREGDFLMPVDRVFSVTGFGTVVTGTIYRGSVREGDSLMAMPQGIATRARSVQVHGKTIPEAFAGQRTAINLASLGLDQIARGDVVCTPGRFQASRRLNVFLQLLKNAPSPVKHWQRVRLHVGTSDVIARVFLLGNPEILPGEGASAQLYLENPLATSVGDRFVIRFYSPLRTIGGGTVLLTEAKRPRGRDGKPRVAHFLRELHSHLEAHDPAGFLDTIISEAGCISHEDLAKRAQMTPNQIASILAILEKSGRVVVVQNAFCCSREYANILLERIEKKLADFHASFAESSGMPLEELAAVSSLDAKAFRALADSLRARESFLIEGNRARLASFEPTRADPFADHAKRFRELALDRGYDLPSLTELPELVALNRNETSRFVAYLKERGLASLIGEELILLAEVERRYYDLLHALTGDVTVASVRDATQTSRKKVLPVLEYFDSRQITRRTGDKRILIK